MKHFSFFLLLAVAGCAGTPPTPVASPEQVAKSAADVRAPEQVTTDSIMAAQEGGQTVVNEEGQKMICRQEKKTGSHIQQKTICMTKEDWDKAAEAGNQTVRDMARQRPPPVGN